MSFWSLHRRPKRPRPANSSNQGSPRSALGNKRLAVAKSGASPAPHGQENQRPRPIAAALPAKASRGRLGTLSALRALKQTFQTILHPRAKLSPQPPPCRESHTPQRVKVRRIPKETQKAALGHRHTYSEVHIGAEIYTMSESIDRGSSKKFHYARRQSDGLMVAMVEFRHKKKPSHHEPDRLFRGRKTDPSSIQVAREEFFQTLSIRADLDSYRTEQAYQGFAKTAVGRLRALTRRKQAGSYAFQADETGAKSYMVMPLSIGNGSVVIDELEKMATSAADRIYVRRAAAASFCCQTALELDALDVKRQLAHCDVKPENVLVDANGRMHLTDFGYAQRITAKGHTRLRAWIGTIATPETLAWHSTKSQSALPSPGSPVSTATDVYTLAISTLSLLHGEANLPDFAGPFGSKDLGEKTSMLVALGRVAALAQKNQPGDPLSPSGHARLDAFLQACDRTDRLLTRAMLRALRHSPRDRIDATSLARLASHALAATPNDAYEQAFKTLRASQARRQAALETEMKAYERYANQPQRRPFKKL